MPSAAPSGYAGGNEHVTPSFVPPQAYHTLLEYMKKSGKSWERAGHHTCIHTHYYTCIKY